MSPKLDHLLLASFKLGPTLVEQRKFYLASQLIRCLGLNYIRTDLARGVGAKEEVWTGSDVPCHILNAPLHRASERDALSWHSRPRRRSLARRGSLCAKPLKRSER